MRCRRLQRLFLALLEGEVTQPQRHQIETHIAACSACAAEFRSLQQTLHMARAVEVPEPEESYWETFLPALQQRIQQEKALPQPGGFLRQWLGQVARRPALAAVAASLLLVSALPLLRSVWKYQTLPGMALSGSDEVSLVAELDFLKNLDLLEEVDVVEDVDTSR